MSAVRHCSAPVRGRGARLLAAAALVAAGLIPATGAGPAQAAVCGTGVTGVNVIVDLTAFGKGVKKACATGDPTSGLVALTGAGFSYSFVPRLPGFVCRINANPNPCNGAPANAYWSYWHAAKGGAWTYSTKGASSYNPAPGSTEGWSFGAGTAPSVKAP